MKLLLLPLLVGQIFSAPQMSFDSTYEDIMNSFGHVRPRLEKIPSVFEGFGRNFGSRMEHFGQNIGSQVSNIGREVDAFGNRVEQTIHKQVDRLPGMLDQIGDQFHGVRTHLGGHIGSFGSSLMDQFDQRMGGLGLGSFESALLGDMFGHPRQSWWNGDNVCVQKEVVEGAPEDVNVKISGNVNFHMQMSQCQQGDGFYECIQTQGDGGSIKTLKTRYACCHGFSLDKKKGCTPVDLEPLDKTLQELGASQFWDDLVVSGLDSLNNVTVFAPSDLSVEEFHRELEHLQEIEPLDNMIYRVDDGLLSYRRKRSPISIIVAERQEIPDIKDVLEGHIVDGFINTRDLEAEDMLETVNKGKIRISKYAGSGGSIVMANCARITEQDQHATNGIVHVVDKVLQPAKHTIGSILEADQKFQTFVTALEEHDLMSDLHKKDGLTVFAPTDTAFAKLESSVREKVLGKGGCARDIIMSHILPSVVCSGVVVGKISVRNMLGRALTMQPDDDDEAYVEDIKLIIRDKMGTNGVIHVIEDVIVQDSVKNVIEHLEKKQADKFLHLLKTSGVDKTLESLPNITLFLPSAKVLSELPPSVLEEFEKDPKMLRDILLHHVTEEKKSSCDLAHQQQLQTLGGKNLRVNLHTHFGHTRPLAMVQCARVIQSSDEVCGGHVHTIDRLLTPPPGDLLLTLSKEHKKFAELIAFADMAGELSSKAHHTLLAPEDAAFTKLDSKVRDLIFADKNVAADVVKHHLIPDTVCCASVPRIFGFLEQRLARRSKLGEVISLQRSHGGHIYANRASLTKCDVAATNGVMHSLDSLIIPNSIQQQKGRKRKGFWVF